MPQPPPDLDGLAARVARWGWRLLAVASLVAAAFIPLGAQDVPWAEEIVRGTAQRAGFVEPDGGRGDPVPPEEGEGGVYFLTVSERRLSVLEQVLGAGEPQVVTSEAVGRFDADGDFQRSQVVARELALAFDPDPRVVVGADVLGIPDLEPGDRVVAVNGHLVDGLDEAEARLRRWRLARSCRSCDRPLRLVVQRDDRTVQVAVPRWRRHRVELPLEVRPSTQLPPVGDARGGTYEGGSAGLAFTLAYLDRLVGGDLLAGRAVAATGAIDEAGRVGPVGRVPNKLEAAVAAGAEVVFVPDANRAEVPVGVRVPVVAVDSVLDAVRWLCGERTSACAALLPRPGD